MSDLIVGAIYIILPVFLLAMGFLVGRTVESNHFKDLERREQELSGIIKLNLRHLPPNWTASDAILVKGQAVIASDYFKTFASQIRNLFGGEVKSIQTLMVRARKEAMLRMLEQARAHGANCILNMREETSTIGRGSGKQGLLSAEIFVYATAMKVQ